MNELGHAIDADRSSDDGLRLLIVDDNRVIRDAVAALLVNEDGLGSVTATNLGPDTLHDVDEMRPDIVLLPSLGTRTADLTRAITRRFPQTRVIVFGIKELPEPVTQVIEAGAAGYVREDASVEEFRDVVRLVARGEARVAPQIASSLLSRPPASATAS